MSGTAYNKLKMQIKTTVRYYLTWVTMAIINKAITSVGRVVEKNKPLFTAGGNVNWYNHCGKQYGDSSKN